MEGKAIWQSKTLWVNLIAIIALVIQTYTGFVIDPEKQVVILGIINTALRLITKHPVNWGGAKEPSGFVRLRLLLSLAIFAVFLALATLYGCATPGKPQTPQSIAAKSFLSSRQAIIAAGMTADTLCSQGVMKQAECDRAGMIYRQAQAAYATASDAFIIAIQTGNAQSWRDYEQTVPRLMALTMDLDSLVKSFRRSEK